MGAGLSPKPLPLNCAGQSFICAIDLDEGGDAHHHDLHKIFQVAENTQKSRNLGIMTSGGHTEISAASKSLLQTEF